MTIKDRFIYLVIKKLLTGWIFQSKWIHFFKEFKSQILARIYFLQWKSPCCCAYFQTLCLRVVTVYHWDQLEGYTQTKRWRKKKLDKIKQYGLISISLTMKEGINHLTPVFSLTTVDYWCGFKSRCLYFRFFAQSKPYKCSARFLMRKQEVMNHAPGSFRA